MTKDATIKQRIQTGQDMRMFRYKIHRLRRLVSGDVSALTDNPASGTPLSSMESLMRKHYRAQDDNAILYDVLVQDFEEGRSNKLLQAVRTLILQTANTFPEIEFEGLDPKFAIVNAGYCKQRMARCGARHEMRLALADYIISGMGCTMTALKDDFPSIQWIDMLDMVWDLSAKLPHQMRWACARMTQPLYRWLEMFDDGRKYDLTDLDALRQRNRQGGQTSRTATTGGSRGQAGGSTKGYGDDPGDERPISLWWYYDIEGAKGTWAVYVASGDNVGEHAIACKDNPYSQPVGVKDEPMLPFEFMYHLSLPTVKMPPSIVEGMLPAQTAIWQIDRRIRDTFRVGAPYYEREEGSHDEDSFNQWLNGDTGSVLLRKTNKPPLTIGKPLDIPKDWIDYRATNEQEITAQSGANPYASGDRVEGIEYASEVQAIQGNSGLVAGSIAKDGAEYWERVSKKFLAVGKSYDDMPIDIQFDDGVVLHFGADGNPDVRTFLKPDADIVVQEDTMQFTSKLQRIQMAAAQLNQCLNPLMLQMFPNAAPKAFEGWLRAIGEKNIQEWVKGAQPPGQMGQPGQQALPPGVAPGPPQGPPGIPGGAGPIQQMPQLASSSTQ